MLLTPGEQECILVRYVGSVIKLATTIFGALSLDVERRTHFCLCIGWGGWKCNPSRPTVRSEYSANPKVQVLEALEDGVCWIRVDDTGLG